MSRLTLWRLCPAYRADKAMTGDGAHRRGGRWNPPGTRVVYCAESRSLAVVEVLANARLPALLHVQPWVFVAVTVDAELVECPPRVPESWRDLPYTPATQAFGAEWVRSERSAALRVPSAVVAGEFNYLLNPTHPHFSRIKAAPPEPFVFDRRLQAR